MKSKRQAKLLEIVADQAIETQEELLEQLCGHGFKSTQATISRDIRELGLMKVQNKYTAASSRQGEFSLRLQSIFKNSLTSVDLAQNIIVIKTLPGLAPAACSALDDMEHPGVVGTLAGDDTAFVAMRDNEAAKGFVEQIGEML